MALSSQFTHFNLATTQSAPDNPMPYIPHRRPENEAHQVLLQHWQLLLSADDMRKGSAAGPSARPGPVRNGFATVYLCPPL